MYFLQIDANEDGETDDILQEFVITALQPKSITSCIRCSVHSLQLCIRTGLKIAPISNSIDEAR